MSDKCPTCGSSSPRLHPAMQHEGEVQACSDDFHFRKVFPVKSQADVYREGLVEVRTVLTRSAPFDHQETMTLAGDILASTAEAIGMGDAAHEETKNQYRDEVIHGFYEDKWPFYAQGLSGEHELIDVATAEEVNNWVTRTRRAEEALSTSRRLVLGAVMGMYTIFLVALYYA